MAALIEYGISTSFNDKAPAYIDGRHVLNTQFQIDSLEWGANNHRLKTELPHRLECFEIIWIKRGTGLLGVDSQWHEIKDNIICCFAPGQIRHFHTGSCVEGYYISFTADFIYVSEGHAGFSRWVKQFDNNKHLPVANIDKMEIEMGEIVCKMQKEFANYFLLRSEILKGLLNLFMIYFSRKIALKGEERLPNKDSELVKKFMESLRKNFKHKKMVCDYASELCVTPNYLNRTVKKISGFTASYYIQQQIILEAKRQAVYPGVNMKQIAYLLGFDDIAHFSKFFKNNSGMNFSEFKKGLQYSW